MTNNWRVEEGPIDIEWREPDVVAVPLYATTEGQRFPYRLFLTEIDEAQVPLHIIYLFNNPNSRTFRFLRVYKFLIVKGYYSTTSVPLISYRRKLNLEDLIWAGENVDVRILAILPALLIRFPGHFRKIKKMPPRLAKVIKSLRADHTEGPPYRGFPYVLLKSWLQFQPTDGRSSIRQSHRLSVRLEPEVTRHLQQYIGQTGVSISEAVRCAIVNLAQST